MADVYGQISSLVGRFREINDDYQNDVVLALLEQLGTFSANASFRSLLVQSDVTMSLMKIFISRYKSNPKIAKLIAKCLMNVTFGSFSNKLKICRSEEFLKSFKEALEVSDKIVSLQLTRLLGNLAYDEKEELSKPLEGFIPILCDVMEKSFTKNWKRLLCASVGTLWNLSSHSEKNKEAICAHNGALQVLISVLGEKELELVRNATGVLHYISDQFITNVFTHKDIIDTFDLIPQLISILISIRSPHTALNVIGILSALLKDKTYRTQICSNENIYFRLQKMRHSSDRNVCKASTKLLSKITIQQADDIQLKGKRDRLSLRHDSADRERQT
ncbi:hypothetical protein L596_009320 [Steinernema carpocapsae]|uniref:Armadillo repeat-containing domain-containing protein n=1 Tax=Steinernema carpocapsae TaxID=34508 RepID=A0A4U5PF05_STECR|nr:hypothetical protein L596_009320 [Steinernema carpocapsae]